MTTELFRKKSELTRNLSVGAGVAAVGAVIFYLYGGVGAVLLAVGAVGLAGAYLRSKKALVTIDAKSVLLAFSEPVNVPFKSIARAEHLKNHDIELYLHNGSKVLVQVALLEDADSAWLRKALRKEIRAANA